MMGVRALWERWQRRRIRRLLTDRQDLALDVLRADPALSSRTVLQAFGMQAANDPTRRTSEFPFLHQFGRGAASPLASTLPKPMPHNLRVFSEYPPARRAINALCNPVLGLPWKIEPRPDPLATLTPAVEQPVLTPDQKTRILAMTTVLQYPNEDMSWEGFQEMVLEDVVVGGFGAMEVATTGRTDRPVYLWPVDGQSIRINASWDGQPRLYRYAQVLGYAGLAVSTMDMVKLLDDELLYLRLNPRTNTPFGLGYLEVAYESINAYLGAFAFAEQRASNTTPNFILYLGQHVTPQTARQWQVYWETQIEGRGKTPIIGGGEAPEVLSLAGSGEDPLWLAWQEFLIRQIAMAFGLSPMRLGLERDVNRNTSETMASDDWETIAPLANTMRQAVNRILWKILGWTDLHFAWEARDTDERRQADILAVQYTMNAITVDEIRALYSRPPLPDGRGALTKAPYEAAALAASHAPPVGDAALDDDDDAQETDGLDVSLAASGLPLDPADATLRPAARAFLRALTAQAVGGR